MRGETCMAQRCETWSHMRHGCWFHQDTNTRAHSNMNSLVHVPCANMPSPRAEMIFSAAAPDVFSRVCAQTSTTTSDYGLGR